MKDAVREGRLYLKARGEPWPRLVVRIERGVVSYVDPFGWGACSLDSFRRWAARPLDDVDMRTYTADVAAIAARVR